MSPLLGNWSCSPFRGRSPSRNELALTHPQGAVGTESLLARELTLGFIDKQLKELGLQVKPKKIVAKSMLLGSGVAIELFE